jgi:hypothetical protein
LSLADTSSHMARRKEGSGRRCRRYWNS